MWIRKTSVSYAVIVTLCTANLFSKIAASQFPEREIHSIVPVPQAVETSSWWYLRHQAVCALLRDKKTSLLMIGDSITQGWEDDGRTIWDQYYERRQAVNLGFNSDRTEHVLWRLENGEINDIAPR